jgi:uncharacterized protein (DUF1330 family)
VSRTLSISFLVLILAPWLLLVLFLGWYSRGGPPLSQSEVDHYIDTIAGQTQQPGGRHDLVALRSFLESDDGQPFYVVNLFELYDQARYQESPISEGSGTGTGTGTGAEAYGRFAAIMIRLLPRHGSHPIFGSNWIAPETAKWDRIAVNRYRSRRDIAEMFASPEFADAATHKWAAVARNDRTLVQARHLPELTIPALALAGFSSGIGILAWIVSRGRAHRGAAWDGTQAG